MNEVWTKWENLVINGTYPLRRFLSHSDHSVVFLTESKTASNPSAAIKIIPADPARAEMQLSLWKSVATLSHPHLIPILDAGRCQLGGHDFLFVVMEYADQTLAQILPHRPLTPDEVREMLPPLLDALSFLHGKDLVQGRLKPTNVLVVGDRLKLASDTIRHAGQSTAGNANLSPYDPPESRGGRIFAAGDIWALGVTLIEALTQSAPSWPEKRSDNTSLPAGLPPGGRDTLRRCLSRDPANRPSIGDLAGLFKTPAPGPVASVPAPAATPAPVATPAPATIPPTSAARPAPAPAVPARAAPPALAATPAPVARPAPAAITTPAPASRPAPAPAVAASAKQDAPPFRPAPAEPPRTRSLVPGVVGILIVLAAVWLGTWLLRGRPGHPQPAAVIASTTDPAPIAPPPVAPAALATPRTVVHQEIPDASRGARDTIHGDLKILVRVTVDRSGAVVGETLQSQGSSKYFTRLATEAAKRWTFSPSDRDNDQWLLRFDFTRGGVTGLAASQ
jgi:hypothetical protein